MNYDSEEALPPRKGEQVPAVMEQTNEATIDAPVLTIYLNGSALDLTRVEALNLANQITAGLLALELGSLQLSIKGTING